MYGCPYCEYANENIGSVRAHITRKTTGEHKGKSGPQVAEEEFRTEEEPEIKADTEQEPDGGPDGLEFPENPDSDSAVTDGGCCESPEIEGSEGDYYRLDSGEVVQLENSESICLNCEEIHG